ncbi:NUDIX hydrolase [Planctomycetota bacterium]|nr:NUDIX hydrolase [Planctomycetota bacterium]GDY01674.1 NUDIX hydrolase [Planctomycetota bacterium]
MQPLYELLERYAQRDPAAAILAARFVAFARANKDCLLRSCVPGHITASAFILSADDTHCLLTHHRKLQRWLQLGGHVDGEPLVQQAALREAREESGMQQFDLLSLGGQLEPLDLDVHTIPARKQDREHLHWDVRFLLRAHKGQDLVISEESNDLRWIPLVQLGDFCQEESVLRMRQTAATWLARGAVTQNPAD